MEISLQQEINKVRVVNSERRYWFLRTYSGELYNYFLENNFVGLGFNNVPYQYIEEAQISDEATLNRLQKYIDSNSEYKKGEATKWAKQLVTFNHLVKVDDIVIIPSKSSDDLSFGIIESDTFFVKTEKTFLFNERYEPYPEKRKKVKWIKTITKLELRGELKNMFTSRGALSSADTYSEVIEGNLSTVYIKNDVGYLTIKVDEDEEINAFALQEFLSSLTYLYKEFCLEYGIEENEELFIKIKVQSKGGMFLRGLGIAAVVSIAGILSLSDNTNVKLELGNLKVQGSSSGLIKTYSNFLDASQKRQIELQKFLDSRKKLDAKPVKDSVTKEQDTVDSNKIKNGVSLPPPKQ